MNGLRFLDTYEGCYSFACNSGRLIRRAMCRIRTVVNGTGPSEGYIQVQIWTVVRVTKMAGTRMEPLDGQTAKAQLRS